MGSSFSAATKEYKKLLDLLFPHGYESRRVKDGSKVVRPEVGWIIREKNGKALYRIGPCNCKSRGLKEFPLGNGCGAHPLEISKDNLKGKDTGTLCWSFPSGWIKSWTIYYPAKAKKLSLLAQILENG